MVNTSTVEHWSIKSPAGTMTEPVTDGSIYKDTITSQQKFESILDKYRYLGPQVKNPQEPSPDNPSGTYLKVMVMDGIMPKLNKEDSISRETLEKFLEHHTDLRVLTSIEVPDNEKVRSIVNIFNFDLAYGKKSNLVKTITEGLLEYIDGPIIADTIDNHLCRRGWRVIMENFYSGFNDYYLKNRLKANRVNSAYGNMTMLEGLAAIIFTGEDKRMYESTISPELKRLKGLILGLAEATDEKGQEKYEFLPNYHERSAQERRKIVEDLTELAKKGIQLVCRSSTGSVKKGFLPEVV